MTPIWYLGGRALPHTLGADRRHVANLRADAHATLCVDEDPRLTEGSRRARGPSSASPRRRRLEDEGLIREVTEKVLVRYLGPEASAYVDPIMAEGRTIVDAHAVALADLGLQRRTDAVARRCGRRRERRQLAGLQVDADLRRRAPPGRAARRATRRPAARCAPRARPAAPPPGSRSRPTSR